MLAFRDPAQRVFHDDDRAVDNQAEVQRAQAHQVCRQPRFEHARGGHQHRDRDDRRGDQCRAQVSEECEQHGDHQQRTLGKVGRHGLDGGVDQAGAVKHRPDQQVRRQGARDLFQADIHRGGNRPAVLPDPHHGGTDDDLLPAFGCGSESHFLSHADGGDVRNQYRRAASGRDDGLRQFLG